MKRRESRQTFFTNFSFWCNFQGFLYLDVENISNLLFFNRVRDGRCIINNCFVPILFEFLLTSYFDLVETVYLLFARKRICARRYKIRASAGANR